MGVLRSAFTFTAYTSLATAGTLFALTRKSKVGPVPPSDYIFSNTLYARYNPNNAPVTHDICVRRVPLNKVKPELLENNGKLVESFCAGVWGGLGYAYQRRFLEKKYRGPETATQLWDRSQLKTSEYPVGTQITDHFEVVSKNSDSIIVRCGDSPRKVDVRESDGLFEMLAEVKPAEGVVEFGLKSVFYNGLAPADKDGKGPMTPWIQWLHAQYDKFLMETAIRNCMN